MWGSELIVGFVWLTLVGTWPKWKPKGIKIRPSLHERLVAIEANILPKIIEGLGDFRMIDILRDEIGNLQEYRTKHIGELSKIDINVGRLETRLTEAENNARALRGHSDFVDRILQDKLFPRIASLEASLGKQSNTLKTTFSELPRNVMSCIEIHALVRQNVHLSIAFLAARVSGLRESEQGLCAQFDDHLQHTYAVTGHYCLHPNNAQVKLQTYVTGLKNKEYKETSYVKQGFVELGAFLDKSLADQAAEICIWSEVSSTEK